MSLVGTRILVVDDEDDLREILREAFEDVGAVVHEARNGQEGFNLFVSQEIDLIVSDMRMPGGNGLEFLKRVRNERRSDVPFMMVTGFSDVTFDKIFGSGADVVMSKPFRLSELLDKVQSLLVPEQRRKARKAERYNLCEAVSFQVPQLGDSAQATTLNLGMGGMFIQWWNPSIVPGHEIQFNLAYPSGAIKGNGIIRWFRSETTSEWPAGIGVEFVDLSENTLSQLRELIELRRGKRS